MGQPKKNGIGSTGIVRDIVEIPGSNGTYVLFLINDEYPALYKLNQGLQK